VVTYDISRNLRRRFVVVFIFLQLRRFQSRHGDAQQQQKEKSVILPTCFSAIDRRPGSLSGEGVGFSAEQRFDLLLAVI
jgi:hypothetical protein